MAQRSDTRRLDTEGDMDDAGGLDDEDAQAAQPAARVARGTPSPLSLTLLSPYLLDIGSEI